MGGREDYRTWEQVSGYFDGDGNVGLEKLARILHLRLRFVDTWRPQIEAIKRFLDKQGIRSGAIGVDNKKDQQPVFRLEVSAVSSVLKVAKLMIPHCVKKAEDLRITVKYLEDKITGSEALQAFNAEVASGRRRGEYRKVDMDFKRSEGLLTSKRGNAAKARAAYAVHVSLDVCEQIRRDHADLKYGAVTLSRKYGYSEKVIRRVLRGD